MLCCSIAAFILSQLYAGVMGLRALFFGAPDALVGQPPRRGNMMTAALDFTPTRMAVTMAVGLLGLAVAWAVRDSAIAHAPGWVPVATAYCGKALSAI